MPLRRSEQSEFLHHVVEQLRAACVEGHRGIGIVGLAAYDRHGNRAGTHDIFVAGQYVLACHRQHLAPLREIDADVLRRIFRGGSTLYSDVAVGEYEVIVAAERRVEVHVGEKVGLLLLVSYTSLSMF